MPTESPKISIIEETSSTTTSDTSSEMDTDYNSCVMTYANDEMALAHEKGVCNSASTCDNCCKMRKDNTNLGVMSKLFGQKVVNACDHNPKYHGRENKNGSVPGYEDFSTSIFDHIESFTFDDLAKPTFPEPNYPKIKFKNGTSYLNRIRKPNFPGYSESFRQILEKRSFFTLNKSIIDRKFSRNKRGDAKQNDKIVEKEESIITVEDESRFEKDRDKIDPKMTYDRRKCKKQVLNKELAGGDVYVDVVKQPVVPREIEPDNTMNRQSKISGAYQNFDELESLAEIIGIPPKVNGSIYATELTIKDNNVSETNVDTFSCINEKGNMKCEILTSV